jgi:hypothetical protein
MIINDKVLKNECNSKIKRLNKLEKQIKNESKISEFTYNKLKSLGLIKKSCAKLIVKTRNIVKNKNLQNVIFIIKKNYYLSFS